MRYVKNALFIATILLLFNNCKVEKQKDKKIFIIVNQFFKHSNVNITLDKRVVLSRNITSKLHDHAYVLEKKITNAEHSINVTVDKKNAQKITFNASEYETESLYLLINYFPLHNEVALFLYTSPPPPY